MSLGLPKTKEAVPLNFPLSDVRAWIRVAKNPIVMHTSHLILPTSQSSPQFKYIYYVPDSSQFFCVLFKAREMLLLPLLNAHVVHSRSETLTELLYTTQKI